ncbi:MAG TPA: NUDIX domain-containing protein [Candidatus Saccharimonadales bacterium]|nr:NUDIX domain-containing protein [Candidatus Saccharimonadales bacterium]
MSTEDIFHLGVKALIRNQTGKILLLQVNPQKLRNDRTAYWDLPGGRVQKGDTVEDTLLREIEEETGIQKIDAIKPLTTVLSNIRIPLEEGSSVGLILSVYTCSVPTDSVVTISDEHTKQAWFAPQEAAELLGVKYPPEFCSAIAELA